MRCSIAILIVNRKCECEVDVNSNNQQQIAEACDANMHLTPTSATRNPAVAVDQRQYAARMAPSFMVLRARLLALWRLLTVAVHVLVLSLVLVVGAVPDELPEQRGGRDVPVAPRAEVVEHAQQRLRLLVVLGNGFSFRIVLPPHTQTSQKC